MSIVMSVCAVCFLQCLLLAGWVWALDERLSLPPHTRYIWEHVVNPSLDCLGSGFKVVFLELLVFCVLVHLVVF